MLFRSHNARPEGTLPGVPEMYASMVQRNGVAHGVFVTSFDGRPIHVAGNPLHPIVGDPKRYAEGDLKMGAADAFTIASILDMYDPDRMDEEFPLVREAHERNDETLERIYIGRRFKNDTERLEKLFDLYTKMTAAEDAA